MIGRPGGGVRDMMNVSQMLGLELCPVFQKELFKEFFFVVAVSTGEQDSARQYPPPPLPSNDYCYLTQDQWLWLTSTPNVSASAIVSHSAGNYIFSLLHSLSDSPLNGDQ